MEEELPKIQFKPYSSSVNNQANFGARNRPQMFRDPRQNRSEGGVNIPQKPRNMEALQNLPEYSQTRQDLSQLFNTGISQQVMFQNLYNQNQPYPVLIEPQYGVMEGKFNQEGIQSGEYLDDLGDLEDSEYNEALLTRDEDSNNEGPEELYERSKSPESEVEYLPSKAQTTIMLDLTNRENLSQNKSKIKHQK